MMQGERMALSQSAWADLDALVLEEVKALKSVPVKRPEPPDFASGDDFISRATTYLEQHDDPRRLITDLIMRLGLSMSADPEVPEAREDTRGPEEPITPPDAPATEAPIDIRSGP